MSILALILIFVIVPIAELYVILQVGDAIGVGPTIPLLVADSLLGSFLLRTQGRTVWRRFNVALAEGRMPHREVLDGVLGDLRRGLPHHPRVPHRRLRSGAPAAPDPRGHPPARWSPVPRAAGSSWE